jgi:hypothetical protein
MQTLIKLISFPSINLAKVTDINEITKFGAMITPALAIDGKVKSVGKVLSKEEIKKILG